MPAFFSRLRIRHLESAKCIEDDLRDNEPGVVLVVGRDDVPERVERTRRVQAFLKSLHVLLPVGPLVNVRKAELPVLLGRVDAITKAVRLLALRQMQEDLDHPSAVAMEMLLEVTDRAEPVIPEGLPVDQLTWEALVVKDLRVDADDEHVLVVGTIEDADPPALGLSTGGTPEEVVLEFLGAGLLEAEALTRRGSHATCRPARRVPQRVPQPRHVHPHPAMSACVPTAD